jgi:hypothetical protein
MPFSTIDKGSKHFNIILRNGGGGTFTGLGFQPDLVWQKARNTASSHYLHDAVRGVTKALFSNSTSAEATYTDQITSFDTDGFTVNAGGDWGSGTTVVDWCWKANGAGSSNTSGTISSTVSANTTSGFSVVTYTGNGTTGATIGHGLGVAPRMIIIKNRNNAYNWIVYHATAGNTGDLKLQSTGGFGVDINDFNNTSPTSSVFTVGNNIAVNNSGNSHVAYCFAEVKGFSKFGGYTGNGSTDGTFVYTGFKPAYVMSKGSSLASSWNIQTNQLQTYNDGSMPYFKANTADAELSATNMDFLSNGFKLRTTDNDWNGSGATYIYMAFAENPFVSSKSIPTTAR